MRSIDIEQIDSHRHRNNSGSNNNISNSRKRKNDPAPKVRCFFLQKCFILGSRYVKLCVYNSIEYILVRCKVSNTFL